MSLKNGTPSKSTIKAKLQPVVGQFPAESRPGAQALVDLLVDLLIDRESSIRRDATAYVDQEVD
jgi:hypothetical protein